MARSERVRDLLILRHAKSDWAHPGLDDHDRPLAPRGLDAAPLMGRFLSAVRAIPERIVTSSARRAVDTARLAAEAGRWECPTEVTDELYGTGFDGVLRIVRSQPPEVGVLLLVGHEPTLSTTLGRLVGGSAIRFPTAAVARVRFSAESWREVGPGAGTLSWLVTPKLLTSWTG